MLSISSFYKLFGYPKSNFRSLTRKKSHSSKVKHFVLSYSIRRLTKNRVSKPDQLHQNIRKETFNLKLIRYINLLLSQLREEKK